MRDCAERIKSKHESAMLKSIVSKQNNETVEEEMRLFYVALTRAVNKLTITGSYNIGSIISKINSSLSMPELPVFPFEVYSSRSFLQWILYCLKDIPKDCYSLEVNPSLRCLPLKAAYRTNNNTETCTVSISDEELSDLSLLDMDYPYKYSAKIPAKLSVSKLTPNILDSADDCTAVLEIPYIRQKTPLPSFMTDEKTQNGSAAGTATHEFMQFCDFGRIEKNGIDKEIEYLVSKRFLSKEKAGLISRKALSGFFASKLYEDMKNADEIFREMRFNIKLPAGLFTENAERYKNISDDEVLVQGVMDCIFRDKNGDYTLIDYKTDSIGSGMSTAEFENELKKRYSSQLGYYSIAAEQLFGKSPKKIMLYSFALADTITLFYNESAD